MEDSVKSRVSRVLLAAVACYQGGSWENCPGHLEHWMKSLGYQGHRVKSPVDLEHMVKSPGHM